MRVQARGQRLKFEPVDDEVGQGLMEIQFRLRQGLLGVQQVQLSAVARLDTQAGRVAPRRAGFPRLA